MKTSKNEIMNESSWKYHRRMTTKIKDLKPIEDYQALYLSLDRKVREDIKETSYNIEGWEISAATLKDRVYLIVEDDQLPSLFFVLANNVLENKGKLTSDKSRCANEYNLFVNSDYYGIPRSNVISEDSNSEKERTIARLYNEGFIDKAKVLELLKAWRLELDIETTYVDDIIYPSNQKELEYYARYLGLADLPFKPRGKERVLNLYSARANDKDYAILEIV